jgi:hypothetical protein
MATHVQARDKRAAQTGAIYGVVSIAAVIVAWEADGNDWHLIEVISGYLVVLWSTHAYARLISSGELASWRSALRHEFPVAAAGLPALAVAVVGQIVNWDLEHVSLIALMACGVTLVAIQIAILRPLGTGRTRVAITVICDLICAALIIYLHIVI